MKVRLVLLAVVLSCGLATLAEARTQSPTAAAHARAAAAARKRAKQQAKARNKAVRRHVKTARAVRRPATR